MRFKEKSGKLVRFKEKSGELERFKEKSGELERFQENSGELERFKEKSGELGRFKEKSRELGRFKEKSGELGRFKKRLGELGRFKEGNWVDLRFFQISHFLRSEKEIWRITSKTEFKDSRGNVDILFIEPFKCFTSVHNRVLEAYLRPRQTVTMELFENSSKVFDRVLSLSFRLGTIHLVRMQNFPKNWHFLPPDMHTFACVSAGKKC